MAEFLKKQIMIRMNTHQGAACSTGNLLTIKGILVDPEIVVLQALVPGTGDARGKWNSSCVKPDEI